MDKLVSLYERMKKLREAGVRMKDISEETGIASGRTLLALFFRAPHIHQSALRRMRYGKCVRPRAATSQQRVETQTARLPRRIVRQSEPHRATFRFQQKRRTTFLDDIEKEAIKYLPNAGIYTGLYQSYSSSSYSDGLKVEPYMISSIVDGDTMPKVYCQNLAGDYYIGVGLFSPFQIGYLMFNEQKRLQLALKVVYLQLPIIEYPQIMKGIYLTHDYNRNPIARRILFVRQGDEIPLEEFADLRTEVIP